MKRKTFGFLALPFILIPPALASGVNATGSLELQESTTKTLELTVGARPLGDDILMRLLSRSSIRKVPIHGPDDPHDQYLLVVDLPVLSLQEFESLKKQLSSDPDLRFSQEKKYTLKDFLPFFAREAVNRRLVGKAVYPKKESEILKQAKVAFENPKTLHANCHSLTRLWIEHFQNPESKARLYSGYFGSKLVAFWPEGAQLKIDEIQPQDMVFVSGPITIGQGDGIYHSAIYLGGGLVLEKGDEASQYPYRIAELSDLIEKYMNLDREGMSVGALRPSILPKIPTIAEEYSFDRALNELMQTKESGDVRVNVDIEKVRALNPTFKKMVGLTLEYIKSPEEMTLDLIPFFAFSDPAVLGPDLTVKQ